MSGADKRRWTRKPIKLVVSYSYYAGTFVTSAGRTITLNLSEQGALIEMPERIPLDEIITLEMHLDFADLIMLQAHVVHVGTRQNNLYPIGVSFRNLTPDDEYKLNRQMQKDASIPGKERRQTSRKPIHIAARYSYYAKTFVTSMGETITLNLSQRGALVQLSEPIPVNEIMMLTLNLERGNPIVLESRVAHVSPLPQHKFAIGVEFKNLLPNDEYLLRLQLDKPAPISR
jgi:hypothetical protein